MIPDPDVQRQLILQEREKSRSRRAMAEAVAKETRERHRDTQWQRHLQRSYSKFDCTSKSESKAFKSHFTCYSISRNPATLFPHTSTRKTCRWRQRRLNRPRCGMNLPWLPILNTSNIIEPVSDLNSFKWPPHHSTFVSMCQSVFFPFSSHHSVRSTRMTGGVFQDRQTTEEPAEAEEVDYSDYSSKEKI